MKLFKRFTSQSFETVEEKGDRLVESGDLGLAKLQYEKAMERLVGAHTPDHEEHRQRIHSKIDQTCETLAHQHKSTAVNLIEAGCFEEAGELLILAQDLTSDTELATQVGSLLQRVEKGMQTAVDILIDTDHDDPDYFDPGDESDYFDILISSLPEEVQDTYMDLGEEFKTGYVALNEGDFERASQKLQKAMVNQGDKITYVHLELATARLNMGETDMARELLETFVSTFPQVLRAYELLCELYWDAGEYDQADYLLQACPDTIKTSQSILLLMGATLLRSGKHEDALSFYQKSIEYLGWSESIAIALAQSYEAMQRQNEALATYAEVINSCKSCHKRVDPFVKQRYAELMYQSGDASGGLVEMYFTLCQEDSPNAYRYYQRISAIYQRQGHTDEAKRYQEIARQAEQKAVSYKD